MRTWHKGAKVKREDMPRNELVGKRFGRLIVIKYTSRNKGGDAYWLCRCNCGTKKVILGKNLTTGDTKSCGCITEEKKLTPGDRGFNEVWKTYINNAKKRKLPFELTKEQVKSLTKQNCRYCGKEPAQIRVNVGARVGSRTYNRTKYVYNGIDRRDSTKGFVIGNCVACCKRCNSAKSNMKEQEFLGWVKKVYEHRRLKIW